MALRTLGLDLGIASIGWALIEENGKKHTLLNWGSRIFQPGMDELNTGKGESRCAQRRLHNALRTQYHRRRERKEQLISVLIDGGLLTKAPDEKFFTDIDKRLLDTLPQNLRP